MKRVRLNNKVRKAFQSRARGFTMIEVVIAIAIIGIIGVAVMSALATASIALIIADERATAESLARSQMEFVKDQGYNATQPGGEVIYTKIPDIDIPEGYAIWSVNRDGEVVGDVIGIPWAGNASKPANEDGGIQKIALVITHKDRENQDKVIYSFINDNPDWADGVKITLEGYKRAPVT
jgi:prepilin-type N-terminal cleavage/methylation domain-containing protein